MQIIFYFIIGLFGLMGVGILNTASQIKFRHLGLLIGALCYLGGAIL
jgi:hypothetical protein